MAAQIVVELDIFSGMPNPTWTLSGDDANAAVEKLAALAPMRSGTLTTNLGYRGFVLQLMNGPASEVIHIWNGIVQRTRAGQQRYFRDVDRQVEKWLLNTGRRCLDSGIVAIVEQELRK